MIPIQSVPEVVDVQFYLYVYVSSSVLTVPQSVYVWRLSHQRTTTNIEDPDETAHDMSFHKGLHCLINS